MKKQLLHPQSIVLHVSQKNRSKARRFEALAWLAKRFPEAFNNQEIIRPLKRGIMADILAYAAEAEMAGISKSKLRQAVVLFTRRVDYLTCLKAREMRVDLFGNAIEPVTEEESISAALKLKKKLSRGVKSSAHHGRAHASSNNAGVGSSTQDRKEVRAKPTIKIQHKNHRILDSSAVARIKEKLGLTTSAELED